MTLVESSSGPRVGSGRLGVKLGTGAGSVVGGLPPVNLTPPVITGGGGGTPVTVRQFIFPGILNAASQVATLVAASTLNDSLVVGVQVFDLGKTGTASITSVTDDAAGGSNVYVQKGLITLPVGTSFDIVLAFYLAVNAKAAQNFTVALNTSNYANVGVWDCLQSTFDQVITNSGSGTAPDTGSLTPPVNGALALAMAVGDNNAVGSLAHSAGWTVDGHQEGGTDVAAFVSQAQSTAGPMDDAMTMSTGLWWTSMMTLKP